MEIHRDHFERVRAALPADRSHLLDIRRATVRDVPQVSDPRRHLRKEPKTIDSRPDPETGERRVDAPAPSPKARAPRVSGEH